MIPLVVRSHFSLMWGAASVKALCRSARQKGYTRLALTDTDNLYGLWPFLKACRLEGIDPMIGAEITDPASGRRAVCLVENQVGYQGLCRLLTRRHQQPDFNLAADLAAHPAAHGSGLILLATDPELLTTWHDAGLSVAAALPIRPGGPSERAWKTAGYLGIPAVAVPDACFLEPGGYQLHRVLRAIDLNTALSRLKPEDLAPNSAWLATPDEYERRFEVLPDAVKNSHLLAERLAFRGPDTQTIMPPWSDPYGRDAKTLLRQTAYEGARQIYGHDLSEAVVERLEHELTLIEAKQFSSYFLVVRDIIQRSPRICGRGSGAASLVAYCLGITNVCPLKHDLYFERFINAERKDPPDIDVDFAWDERDGVLDSVLEQYRGHAAMVCNHVLFQPRMALREVAKVYGLTEREITAITRRLPWFWRSHSFQTDMKAKIYAAPETKSLDFPPPWPEIIDLAQTLVGTPRYLSVHPGGVVITPLPIDGYAPVERAPKGVPIIQWEKDGTEEAGLVKIDLLGNRSLGVIRDAVANVLANGEPFDEWSWEPEDDPATRDAVAKGLTMGCFYIESPATRLLQKKARTGDFEHLVIHSSIIRPAANDFIQEYLRRLHGGPWEPIHPLLKDILDETYGIMVYQEDVSKTAVAMAGFSHAEADALRKIMSKKDKELELNHFRKRFTEGARIKGVTDQQIDQVWNMMLSFSGYSFCKPHSASYARVSFQAAYLKVHYPAEFMAAVISNQGGFYSAFAYVSEARRMGVTILPPDVNQSELRWKGRSRFMLVGLQAVKGLGRETMTRILEERRHRAFANFDDFHRRVRPDEDEARNLIHAGAFDALHPGEDHAALLWRLARFKSASRSNAAAGLFDLTGSDPAPVIPPGNERERLRQEFAVLGFLTDRHPITLFEEALPRSWIIKADEIYRYIGRRVRVAGWLLTGKLIKTKKGDPMQFLTFEDETAIFETTFFPQAYQRFCQMLDWNRPYLLTGKVEENYDALSLTVSQVTPVNAPAGRQGSSAPPRHAVR